MRINNNLMAMNTHRQLGINSNAGAKSIEKLSSGYRINRAGDDAAGLAISEKMRGQIRGLTQASRNSQDGISLIQTAEGALNETHAILQRMRELAVQSATDTNTNEDRSKLQSELSQLTSEITRISTTTEFNTKKLLNGDMGMKIALNTNNAELFDIRATGSTLADGNYTITMTAAGNDSATGSNDSIATTSGTYALNAAAEIDYGVYTLRSTNLTATDVTLSLYGPSGNLVRSQDGVALDATLTNFGGFDLDFNTNNIDGEGSLTLTVNNTTANVTVTDPSTATSATGVIATGLAATNGVVSIGGFEFTLKTNHGADATTSTLTLANNAATFHIGANQDQNTKLAINNMDATALRVNNVDLSTQSGANTAITTINNALESVSEERAKLGAMQNRLEHTIKNLDTSAENLQASESRVRDVDMAKEMMNFTKNNILQQAAQAMLAQANQQPQGVLQLLR